MPSAATKVRPRFALATPKKPGMVSGATTSGLILPTVPHIPACALQICLAVLVWVHSGEPGRAAGGNGNGARGGTGRRGIPEHPLMKQPLGSKIQLR